MNLQQQANAALRACAARGGGPHKIELREGPTSLAAELPTIDSLACEFSYLTLHAPILADASTEQLKSMATGLAQRLTYLVEPISPIETDAEGCVVQLRSNPPQRGDDGTCYFELLVRRGGELDLRRWKKSASGQRSPVTATITREVLLRLIGDFAKALA